MSSINFIVRTSIITSSFGWFAILLNRLEYIFLTYVKKMKKIILIILRFNTVKYQLNQYRKKKLVSKCFEIVFFFFCKYEMARVKNIQFNRRLSAPVHESHAVLLQWPLLMSFVVIFTSVSSCSIQIIETNVLWQLKMENHFCQTIV